MGPHRSNGYGFVWVGEVRVQARRMALFLAHGTVTPAEEYLKTTCWNRDCVNPDHMLYSALWKDKGSLESLLKDAKARNFWSSSTIPKNRAEDLICCVDIVEMSINAAAKYMGLKRSTAQRWYKKYAKTMFKS